MSTKAKILDEEYGHIRLPERGILEEKETRIWKDPTTGEVILSRKPENWDEFFDEIEEAGVKYYPD